MSRKICFFIVAMTLILSACARREETYKDTRFIMGTYVTITAVRGDMPDDAVKRAVDAAFGEIVRVDRLMSTYKPESQLSRVNRLAGAGLVKVDPEVIAAVGRALDVARMTGGAFDPTVGPLVRLWGIGGENARVPSGKDIKDKMMLVDYTEVGLDRKGGTVSLGKKGMSIDLGGIAKGYASDLAVESLNKSGVKGGIVAVAGDLKLFGLRPDGKPWNIGIQHPREKEGLLVSLPLTGAATSSSGDYERYFVKDGVRYHHIMDPKTGHPARGLMSVTVVAKQSWMADSMATGIFVMGPEKGYEFAKAHPELEVLMVTSEGKILATGRFKDLKVDAVKTPRPPQGSTTGQ